MISYLWYKKQMKVMDADDTETWITVKGNHIPVKKGQSKSEAVKEFISKKSDKEMSKRENEPKSLGESLKKVVSQVEKNKQLYGEYKKQESAEKYKKLNSERSNKPKTIGESAKKVVANVKLSKIDDVDEEVGFPMLEIASNDVEFGKNSSENRSKLLKSIKESEHENADIMKEIVSDLPDESFKNEDSFRKSVGNIMKKFKD